MAGKQVGYSSGPSRQPRPTLTYKLRKRLMSERGWQRYVAELAMKGAFEERKLKPPRNPQVFGPAPRSQPYPPKPPPLSSKEIRQRQRRKSREESGAAIRHAVTNVDPRCLDCRGTGTIRLGETIEGRKVTQACNCFYGVERRWTTERRLMEYWSLHKFDAGKDQVKRILRAMAQYPRGSDEYYAVCREGEAFMDKNPVVPKTCAMIVRM